MKASRYLRRLAALLIPAAAVFIALPALPASANTGSLHETFGSWYVGGTTQPGDQAINVSSPGRTIIFANGPGGTGTLQSAQFTGICLAPAGPDNMVIEWRNCFMDIVPNQRIVISQSMDFRSKRVSAALVTIELVKTEKGTDLICTHHAAFFEGADGPQMREHGWRALFDRLGKELDS